MSSQQLRASCQTWLRFGASPMSLLIASVPLSHQSVGSSQLLLEPERTHTDIKQSVFTARTIRMQSQDCTERQPSCVYTLRFWSGHIQERTLPYGSFQVRAAKQCMPGQCRPTKTNYLL